MKIGIFASGSGSNFQALVDAFRDDPEITIAFLFSDKADAFVLERALKEGIKTYSFAPSHFTTRLLYEEELVCICKKADLDYIVLAGYMRLVGAPLLENYPNRILNIHPSLLPQFSGRHGIQDAYEAGVKETGVTIHYIDHDIDTGPIIHQESVVVSDGMTIEELETAIHKIEHRIYPMVIKNLARKGDLFESGIN